MRTAVEAPRNWKPGFGRGDDGYLRFQRTYAGPTIGIKFEPRDIWIGVFWKRDELLAVAQRAPKGGPNEGAFSVGVTGWFWTVYICLLPCLPIRIAWIREAS